MIVFIWKMCAIHFIPTIRIDSTMQVRGGFEVVSVDAFDKMLKYALKER